MYKYKKNGYFFSRSSMDIFEVVQALLNIFTRKDGWAMKINDELLEKLGTYFVYHEVYDTYGLTFESFVDRWTRGILEL